jgi:hypothetical protein
MCWGIRFIQGVTIAVAIYIWYQAADQQLGICVIYVPIKRLTAPTSYVGKLCSFAFRVFQLHLRCIYVVSSCWSAAWYQHYVYSCSNGWSLPRHVSGNYVHLHLGWNDYLCDISMWYQAADQQLGCSMVVSSCWSAAWYLRNLHSY